MPNYFSDTLASAQAATSTETTFASPVGLQHGRVRVASGKVESVGGNFDTANNDTICLARLKATDRFLACVVWGNGGESTAGQLFDVGLWARNSDGSIGSVADRDCFANNAAVGVTAGISFGAESNGHAGKTMYEIAGDTAAAAPDEYYLVIATDAANGTFDSTSYRFGATLFYTSGD